MTKQVRARRDDDVGLLRRGGRAQKRPDAGPTSLRGERAREAHTRHTEGWRQFADQGWEGILATNDSARHGRRTQPGRRRSARWLTDMARWTTDPTRTAVTREDDEFW